MIPNSVQMSNVICHLRVGVFECTIWSHVLDDISQDSVHLSFREMLAGVFYPYFGTINVILWILQLSDNFPSFIEDLKSVTLGGISQGQV